MSQEIYKYSNKGTINTFDLSQLTPEELSKFNKMNDKQKVRFIAAYELTKDDDMPEIMSVKPEFTGQDENAKHNTYARLNKMVDSLKEIKSKYPSLINANLLDEDLKNKMTAKKDSLIQTRTGYSNILSAPNTPETRKAELTAKVQNINQQITKLDNLIRQVDDFKKEVKNTLQSELGRLGQNSDSLTLSSIIKKYENDMISNFPYLQESINPMASVSKTKRESENINLGNVGTNITNIIEFLQDPANPILEDAIKNFSNDLKLLKALDEQNIGEVINRLKELSKESKEAKKLYEEEREYLSGMKTLLQEVGIKIENINNMTEDQLKEIQKKLDTELNNITETFEDFGLTEKQIKENINTLAKVYSNLKEYITAADEIKGKYAKQTIDSMKFVLDSLNMKDTAPFYKASTIPDMNAFWDEYVVKQNDNVVIPSNNRTNTIKDIARSFRNIYSAVLTPLIPPEKAEEIRMPEPLPITSKTEVEVKEVGEGYFSDLKNKIKNISKAPNEISELKSELSDLKKEILELKDYIKNNSEQAKHNEIISSEKLNVPPPSKINVPVEKNIAKSKNWLDEILENRELKHIEEVKNPVNFENENSIESDLQKAMEERRKDIEPDEYEEDDEDWGEGVRRLSKNKKAGIPRRRMLMSDYLSMF